MPQEPEPVTASRSRTGVPFESESQRTAHERLREPLERAFPEQVQERIHAIGYTVRLEGAVVTCTLSPWGDDDATIAVRSYLAGAVPMGEAVLRELASWTSELRFGLFGVDASDNVYAEQQFVASTTTVGVLARSVREVMGMAAGRRGDVRERFGGSDL